MKIFKGKILTPADKNNILQYDYMLVENNIIKAVFDDIPAELSHVEIIDCEDKLIIPGFVDTHLHAPQYANIGLGLDLELIPWLNKYTFPEERNFKDVDYAEKVYSKLIEDLINKGTTSSIIFGSLYAHTTRLLAHKLRQKGLRSLVGKVNMDRNSPDFYIESTAESIENTQKFIEDVLADSQEFGDEELVKPIITPRFIPTCTPKLMQALGDFAEKYDLSIQSHLSENRNEIAWVKELHPECDSYFDVYLHYGLIRPNKTIMAHCVWSDQEEQNLLKKYGVMIAHAPFSNANLSSGVAPIVNMLDADCRIGLSSDISGGNELFMGRIIGQAAIASKFRYAHMSEQHLTTTNLFYLATKGGGSFMGKVGSLEPNYYADFLVIDDSELSSKDPHQRTSEERLQRFFYNGNENNIEQVYVNGKRLK